MTLYWIKTIAQFATSQTSPTTSSLTISSPAKNPKPTLRKHNDCKRWICWWQLHRQDKPQYLHIELEIREETKWLHFNNHYFSSSVIIASFSLTLLQCHSTFHSGFVKTRNWQHIHMWWPFWILGFSPHLCKKGKY